MYSGGRGSPPPRLRAPPASRRHPPGKGAAASPRRQRRRRRQLEEKQEENEEQRAYNQVPGKGRGPPARRDRQHVERAGGGQTRPRRAALGMTASTCPALAAPRAAGRKEGLALRNSAGF